jgi:hypothetical protein
MLRKINPGLAFIASALSFNFYISPTFGTRYAPASKMLCGLPTVVIGQL